MFNKIPSYFSVSHSDKVVLSFCGEITGAVIDDFCARTEALLMNTELTVLKKKKLINILTESMQNVFHHQDPNFHISNASFDFDASPFVIVLHLENGKFEVSTGNVVASANTTFLMGKMDSINKLGPAELREQHVLHLANTNLSEKGGAGLGFLDLARKSGNPLKYQFIKLNEMYSYFIVSILID